MSKPEWPDLTRKDLFMKRTDFRVEVVRPLIEAYGLQAVCARWGLSEFTVKRWLEIVKSPP